MRARVTGAGAVWLEMLAVLAAIALFASQIDIRRYIWAQMALYGASFAIRWLSTGRPAKATPLDGPLALFALSSVVGVWAAYQVETALLFFSLIIGAIALYYLLVSRSSPFMFQVWMVMLVVLGVALSVCFITQHDYSSNAGKIPLIDQVGLLINAHAPRLLAQVAHPNHVAGVLEVVLPFGVAYSQALWGERRRPRVAAVVCGAATAIILVGVIMTSSRGAWLAILIVSVCALAARVARSVAAALRQHRLWLATIGVGLALAGVMSALILATQPALAAAFLGGAGAGRLLAQMDVWLQAWPLLSDYLFTGHGLGMFPMVFSTYALLINVYLLPHAHNTYMQVWLDQGILGIVGLAALIAGYYSWVRRAAKPLPRMAAAGVAATSVMLLHGVLDSPLVTSHGALLLCAPMALTLAAYSAAGIEPAPRPALKAYRLVGAALVILAVLLAVGWKQAAAIWYANLGSVAQQRVELGQYSWPDHLVEYTRRSADLRQAESLLGRALALDPGNVTANQRLASMALARADYSAAQVLLERAYRRDAGNVITWQLLGDAYLALGRLDEAHSLWSRVSDAELKLQGTAWFRYDVTGDEQRAGWARQLAERIALERARKD